MCASCACYFHHRSLEEGYKRALVQCQSCRQAKVRECHKYRYQQMSMYLLAFLVTLLLKTERRIKLLLQYSTRFFSSNEALSIEISALFGILPPWILQSRFSTYKGLGLALTQLNHQGQGQGMGQDSEVSRNLSNLELRCAGNLLVIIILSDIANFIATGKARQIHIPTCSDFNPHEK